MTSWNQSIQSINPINQSSDLTIQQTTDPAIQRSIERSSVPLISRSTNPPIHRSSDLTIQRSTDPAIQRSIQRSSVPSIPRSTNPPIHRSSVPSISRSTDFNNNNNNNIFISYIKYTNITPPANSKANRGRWCVDGLRFITNS